MGLISRRHPAVSRVQLSEHFYSLRGQGFEPMTEETGTKDLSLTWTDGWAISRVAQSLDQMRGWALRGESDLVGAFTLGDPKAAVAVEIMRSYSDNLVAEAVARFFVMTGHHVETTNERDLTTLFELLTDMEEPCGFPIPHDIGLQLAKQMGPELIAGLADQAQGLGQKSVKNRVELFSMELRRKGYDSLWNVAFSKMN